MTQLPSVPSLLKRHGIKPKKRLGQHFLTAGPTIEKIIVSAEPHKDDIFIEIGPGLGVMTALLAKRCQHVFAVEYDRELFELARTEFDSVKNITWIRADFLQWDMSEVSTTPLKIIGNLPYEITSPILFRLLAQRTRLTKAILMMQKEVADRLTAQPGSKVYGILSVLLQAHATCRRLFDVGPRNFFPPPKVMSAVIELRFDEPHLVKDDDALQRTVHAAFGKRRKTLRNALLGSNLGLEGDAIAQACARAGIDSAKRPEALAVADFIRLAEELFA